MEHAADLETLRKLDQPAVIGAAGVVHSLGERRLHRSPPHAVLQCRSLQLPRERQAAVVMTRLEERQHRLQERGQLGVGPFRLGRPQQVQARQPGMGDRTVEPQALGACDGLLEHLRRTGEVAGEQPGPGELGQQGEPTRLIQGEQSGRATEQVLRGHQVTGKGAKAGGSQPTCGLVAQQRTALGICDPQQGGCLLEVEAGRRVRTLRRQHHRADAVDVGPVVAGQPRLSRLAHQLAGKRPATLQHVEQVALGKSAQLSLDVDVLLALAEREQVLESAVRADDSRALQDRPGLDRQPVQPGGQHGRDRQRRVPHPLTPGLGELLEEQRVAAGRTDQRLGALGVVGQQVLGESAGMLLGQRSHGERDDVPKPPSPVRPELEQLRSGGHEHQDR